MRHILANWATYLIAGFLLLGAVVFGWVRSAQVAVSTESLLLARYYPAGQEGFPWLQLGQEAYVGNCANCHGRDGRGWDQYPGVWHTRGLLGAEGGRSYLINVHLYGLTSGRFRAPMPPMGHMQDVELAAAINYVLSEFDRGSSPESSLYLRPEEIRERRQERLAPADVNRHRPRFFGGARTASAAEGGRPSN